jgi:Holliday junction resolvase-like predicted endonuclease
LVKRHFEFLGYQTLAQKFRSRYAEIDLILYKKEHGLILVEVKSMRFDPSLSPIVSKSQLRRLGRAFVDFQNEMPCAVQLQVVGVDDKNELTVWDEILW